MTRAMMCVREIVTMFPPSSHETLVHRRDTQKKAEGFTDGVFFEATQASELLPDQDGRNPGHFKLSG